MQMKIEGNHEIKMEAKCHKPFLKPVNSKKISSRNNFSNSDSDERVREDVLDSSSKLSHHSKLFVFDRGIRGGWACRRRSMAFSSPPLLSPPHSPPPEEETTPRRACGTRRVASSATTAPSVPQRRADDPPTPASEFDPIDTGSDLQNDDFSKVFKFKFVHLGGDEVNTSCWTTTPHVKAWLNKHHMNESDGYRYFVLQAQKIAISHGYDVINWEETFNNFGNKLSPRPVVHNWLGGGVAQRVAAARLRCIVSNQDKWYLDHLDATWEGFYMNEPLTNISKPEQQKLVLGGEVCMWGEHIDASDIEQTIWPRAAAAAGQRSLLNSR